MTNTDLQAVRESYTGSLAEPGPKPVVRKRAAVCSTDHGIVTSTILRILSEGGTAADAAIAACLVQAVIEPHLTNLAGSVSFLYRDAKSKTVTQLNGTGTLPSDLALFYPIPERITGPFTEPHPCACIPGMVPALAAIHERFGTWQWTDLCEDAIYWAENGYPVSAVQYGKHFRAIPILAFFKEGRDFFMPGGFLRPVGSRWVNADLAATLKRLAVHGPTEFTEGDWARAFVGRANEIGWPIELRHMAETPPRWQEPYQYSVGDYDIFQLAPPERQGVFCQLVLGILSELGYYDLDPDGAEAAYLMAHTLRYCEFETGYLHDPELFNLPHETWGDPDYHRSIAEIIRGSRPLVDLAPHVLQTARDGFTRSSLPGAGPAEQPAGSCEISIVDAEGNWLQMMNTLQSGGIPGMVVGGVPMVGCHAVPGVLDQPISGWIAPGARLRCVLSNTIALRRGEPVLALGATGNVHCTIPQVLGEIICRGVSPDAAIERPRMLPLTNSYVLPAENALSPDTIGNLASLGISVHPLPWYDQSMGSFQICWRDAKSGQLNASADPRLTGVAGGANR